RNHLAEIYSCWQPKQARARQLPLAVQLGEHVRVLQILFAELDVSQAAFRLATSRQSEAPSSKLAERSQMGVPRGELRGRGTGFRLRKPQSQQARVAWHSRTGNTLRAARHESHWTPQLVAPGPD